MQSWSFIIGCKSMKVQEIYESRVASAEQVAAQVQKGNVVCVNGGSSFPSEFVEALAARGPELEGVILNHLMRGGRPLKHDPVAPDLAGHIIHVSDFVWDEPIRKAIWEGRASYRPNYPTEAAKFFPWPIDLFVSTASSMDDHGYMCLGPSGGWGIDFARKAKKIVLEVNPAQPRIHGSCWLHISEVDAVIETDYPMLAMRGDSSEKERPKTEPETAVAGNVLELIEEGCTIQIGGGVIPNVVAASICESGIPHLNIHSDAVSDWLVDLTEAGLIDNRGKTHHPGKSVFAIAAGSTRLYNFLNDNPAMAMLPSSYVNNPALIRNNPKQISINTTLSIDLWGQCASETFGTQHFTGTGGQWEFNRGARLSPGGKGIIAFPSTAQKGKFSRIVASLPEGSAVSISRHDIDHVVTEFGIARLRGKDTRARAEELIAIAHPDFRSELRDAAKRMGLI